jgi:L-aspartate oxidase
MKNDMKTLTAETADAVIVGSGAAGLFAALTLAERAPAAVIHVLSERELGGICASAWSQGGIAAAVAKDDSIDSHVADTLKAAAGTADVAAVQTLVGTAPKYIRLLDQYGVRFERDANGQYVLSREACHAHRRVLKAKAGDGFGAEMMRALSAAVARNPRIRFIAGVSAEQLIRKNAQTGAVQGVLARRLSDNSYITYAAKTVLLATGGAGGLYAMTTNPLQAVGRGIALAARAGAVVSDLEFVQFHPTAIDIGEDPAPLATEALRGEGAYLLNSRGERFMLDYHEMGELAPRDVVSRGIFAQIQKGQKVYLDCRHIDTTHFPALISATKRGGLDPKHDLIPVQPAVHYHMGGIATDLNGRSSLSGLWAAGECAATGLHGANRLASNSLMEAVVMGARAAEDIAVQIKKIPVPVILSVQVQAAVANEPVVVREELRQIMTDMVGVIRDDAGLRRAIADLKRLQDLMQDKDAKTADMALVARMITVSALMRTESRGGHCRGDYTQPQKRWQKRSFYTLKQLDAITADILAPVAIPRREKTA